MVRELSFIVRDVSDMDDNDYERRLEKIGDSLLKALEEVNKMADELRRKNGHNMPGDEET